MHNGYSVLCIVLVQTFARTIVHDYNTQRANLLEEEFDHQLGSRLILNDDEIMVNDILMHWKNREINDSFYNPERFNFSRHYFTYKNDMKKSNVYKIIRKMPKGAALHVHSSLMLSADSLLSLTYEDHLYACLKDDLDLIFAHSVPDRPCPSEWTLLSELRNAADDVIAFDNNIKKHFTMYTLDENLLNENINAVWMRFMKVCRTIKSVINYRPVREKYFYEALKEFYNDNVTYVEIRSGLSELYELDGTKHDVMYMPRLFYRVMKQFKDDYPDFVGAKLIVTTSRSKTPKQISAIMDIAQKTQEEMPDFFAGFDLVGQEDLGRPLTDFLPILADVPNMNFYFHGGETNWFGSSTDENLVDAILLGSKRIGHGYALIKHPTLMAAVKEKDIAIEVNLVSNVVLSLVRDVRNHPLATYLALGLPVVLSSDDPGAWDASPLTDDFYITFVGVASRHADLRMLKQLAINSIRYSSLEDKGKTELFRVFHRKWNEFIFDIISDYA